MTDGRAHGAGGRRRSAPTTSSGCSTTSTRPSACEALALVREGRLYDLGRVLDESMPGVPRPLLPPDARHDRAPRERRRCRSARTGSTGSPRSSPARCSSARTSTRSATCRWATAATTAGRVAELAEPAGVQHLGVETVPQIVTRGWLVDVPRPRLGPRRRDRRRRPRRHRARAGRRRPLPHRLGRALGGRRDRTSPASPGRAASVADWLAEHGVALTGCDTWSYGPVPGRGPGAPVRGAADPERPPRRLHRREPRHLRARRRRRARVRADPHPPEAARRHRRLDARRSPSSEEDVANERPLRRDHHRHRRGRRHARPPARAVRQAHPAARARRLPAARARELGLQARSSARSATSRRGAGIDKDGHAVPARTQQYFVGGNTKFYGAILFRLRERDFGEVAPLRRHLAGVADLLRRPRALLRRGRAALPRPRRARRGPDRAAGAPARSPTPPSRTSRASSSSTTTSCAPAISPFHLPGRRRPRRVRPREGPLRALRPLRRLPVPDRRQGRRARALRPPRARAPRTSRCATHAKVERLETDARGRHGDRRRRRAARPRGDLLARRRRRLLRRGQLGRAAAALGQRPAPERTRQLLRRRRPPLHGPHQLGRDRDLADAEPDEVPEDARRQRLLLGRRRLRVPARAHPDARQDRPAASCGPARRGSPRGRARLHGQARDRLLAHDGGPAAPGQPGHARPPGLDPPRARRTTTPSRTGGCSPSSRGCSAPLGCQPTAIPRWSVLDQRIPIAGVAHQCGTVRFGDDPATSALDVNCKAHDLDNLYVVDTSFFPSSSAVNPALTAMANALRVGDHLLERLGASVERRARRAHHRAEEVLHEDASNTLADEHRPAASSPASPAPRR